MFRNLSKRIEVVTPIFAAGPKQRLWEILDICLRDQREAWVLEPDGKYEQLRPALGSDWPGSRRNPPDPDGPGACPRQSLIIAVRRIPASPA